MQALAASLQNRKLNRYDLLALAGGLAYLLQAIHYARTQLSVLDEGAYLLKGWWFATGAYTPFQDFGPFTNHMPLSFLIPGWAQAAFGPGLVTARSFAVLIGLLFVLGLWLLARRFGGSVWGALAVWVVALNPALIKIYSVGVSQGLIIAMLIWTLCLGLGAGRPRWQLYLASVLAALMALTRLNMTAVLFMLPLYIWWQYSRGTALRSATLGLAVWALGHALFWPGILQMWANYTPENLFPFLDPWRVPTEALPSWTSGGDLLGRSLSVLETLRFHFVPLTMALMAALFWPQRPSGKGIARYRAALFVGLLLAVLLAMHAVASLALDYCVFCFPLYTAFYSALGILLLAIIWPLMPDSLTRWRSRALRLSIPGLLIAAGLGAYLSNAVALLDPRSVRSLLNREVPRFEGLALGEGSIPLWGLLENRFAFTYAESFAAVEDVASIAIIVVLGLALALLLARLARRDWGAWAAALGSPARRVFLLTILLGAVFSPSPALGGGFQTYDCNANMLQAYARLAEELEDYVQPGDLVFWRGGRSAVPLLYLSAVETFPPQLNGDYTYRLAGEAEQLERAGLWGPALLEDWLRQADVILIERDLYRTWLQAAIESGPYELVGQTEPLTECSPRSDVLVYEFRPQ